MFAKQTDLCREPNRQDRRQVLHTHINPIGNDHENDAHPHHLFDIDPVNGWIVADGKLYLNFNGDSNKTFAGNKASLVSKATANWPKLNK